MIKMSERVLPGVSIKEVTEGLTAVVAPGAVACKLVGTACKGPLTAQFFGAGEQDKFNSMYGPADPYQYSSSTSNPKGELTLRRAGDLLFAGMNLRAGSGGLWVARVANATVDAVLKEISIETTVETLIMTAVESGGWYNNFKYTHVVGEDSEGNTQTDNNIFTLHIPSNDKFDSNMDTTNNYSEHVFDGGYVFEHEYQSATAASSPTVSDFVDSWNTSAGSNYFLASTTDASTFTFTAVTTPSYMSGTDSTLGTNWSVDDSASPTTGDIVSALNVIRAVDARVTVVAGATGTYISEGRSHVNACSAEKREQVYVCGMSSNTDQDTLVANALTDSNFNFADARVVKVIPGVELANPYLGHSATDWADSAITSDTSVVLTGGYMAAHVAGLFSCYVPDQAPMNKPVAYGSLEHEFTLVNRKKLVRDDWLIIVSNNGARTLRDLTTAGAADAFYHVSTRMAVDDIKYAIRLAGQPFIGMKNTPRVLGIMRRNLEYVLQGYVTREIINPDWELSITSSRTEQILGVVTVIMKIQPVFYIEFIEITLVLE